MVIKTNQGYKILRKLENIYDKEHYSVKVGQIPLESYHNDLLASAKSWLGDIENTLTKYYDFIHPFTPDAKPF